MDNTILQQDVCHSRIMRDNLFKTYTEFMNNKTGENGGKKSAIDIDLIMTEVKLVETYGKQMMLDIHAGNLMHKAVNSKNKQLETIT